MPGSAGALGMAVTSFTSIQWQRWTVSDGFGTFVGPEAWGLAAATKEFRA